MIPSYLGEPLEPPPVSPARGPPADWGEIVQVHDELHIKQVSTRVTFTITIPAGRPGPKPRRKAG
jgi:hypothetical protein